MFIQEMTEAECLNTLTRTRMGRLGCARENQSYVVPIYLCTRTRIFMALRRRARKSTGCAQIRWSASNSIKTWMRPNGSASSSSGVSRRYRIRNMIKRDGITIVPCLCEKRSETTGESWGTHTRCFNSTHNGGSPVVLLAPTAIPCNRWCLFSIGSASSESAAVGSRPTLAVKKLVLVGKILA